MLTNLLWQASHNTCKSTHIGRKTKKYIKPYVIYNYVVNQSLANIFSVWIMNVLDFANHVYLCYINFSFCPSFFSCFLTKLYIKTIVSSWPTHKHLPGMVWHVGCSWLIPSINDNTIPISQFKKQKDTTNADIHSVLILMSPFPQELITSLNSKFIIPLLSLRVLPLIYVDLNNTVFLCMAFHYMNIPQFIQPFSCWWAFGLLPAFTLIGNTVSSTILVNILRL